MKLRTSMALVGSLIATLWVCPAMAQDTATIRTRASLSVASSANMESIDLVNGLSRQDRRFIRDAAIANRAEVLLGQLAQRNGGDWGREYGKDMEREHNLALESLRKIAMSKGVGLPSDVDAKSKRELRRLSYLRGSSFDNAYRALMLAGHRKVLSGVQSEMRNGHDEMVRGYAVTLEPGVKMHIKMAQMRMTMMGMNSG
jgi:predicted outer membrane protein